MAKPTIAYCLLSTLYQYISSSFFSASQVAGYEWIPLSSEEKDHCLNLIYQEMPEMEACFCFGNYGPCYRAADLSSTGRAFDKYPHPPWLMAPL